MVRNTTSLQHRIYVVGMVSLGDCQSRMVLHYSILLSFSQNTYVAAEFQLAKLRCLLARYGAT